MQFEQTYYFTKIGYPRGTVFAELLKQVFRYKYQSGGVLAGRKVKVKCMQTHMHIYIYIYTYIYIYISILIFVYLQIYLYVDV